MHREVGLRSLKSMAGNLTGTDKTPVLRIAVVLRCQDVGAPLAFLLRSDKTDEVIDAYRIAVLSEPPHCDAFFTSSHTTQTQRTIIGPRSSVNASDRAVQHPDAAVSIN
jgi:hypothetical protein